MGARTRIYTGFIVLLAMQAVTEASPLLFEFDVEVTKGRLSGSVFTGTYTVDSKQYIDRVKPSGAVFSTASSAPGLLSFDITIDGVTFGLDDDRRAEDDGTSQTLPNVSFRNDGQPFQINFSTSKIVPLSVLEPELSIISSSSNLINPRSQFELLFCVPGDVCSSDASASASGFVVRNEAVSDLPDPLDPPPSTVVEPRTILLLGLGAGLMLLGARQPLQENAESA